MSDTCEHCDHPWTAHTNWHGGKQRCECGCYWQPPTPPETPKPPPTERDLLIGRVQAAIFAELDRQHEVDIIQGAGYWDPEWGCLDGEPDWRRVAEAVVAAVEEPPDA